MPVDDILAALRSSGHEVEFFDPYTAMYDDIALGLIRFGGDDADDEGFSPYLQTVLIAQPGYYSRGPHWLPLNDRPT